MNEKCEWIALRSQHDKNEDWKYLFGNLNLHSAVLISLGTLAHLGEGSEDTCHVSSAVIKLILYCLSRLISKISLLISLIENNLLVFFMKVAIRQ